MECQIVTMCGSRCSVQARRSCNVWELKENICCAIGVPEYEQHLYFNEVKMHGDVALTTYSSTTNELPLQIQLVRSRVPDGISHRLASALWRGFRAFGRDCGETMRGTQMGSLLRFAGLHDGDDLSHQLSDAPAVLTFSECLTYVEALQLTLDAPAVLVDLIEDDPNADGDESSNAASEDDAVPDKGATYRDAELERDARLIWKRRQKSYDEV
eukprot:TRINITY_DN65917_c0_g1_i1.p1 TRINITY_DN65917_c0_g1~~TRINITY_DN65917_c0_g1_i1.p1  ORF type:complete len:225 (+),score=50.73 TRINITY_DN65917_c0_g1_i1:39-677(+)